MKIFARNFRGFRRVELDLEKLTFLVGDNSSGKSSLLYLVEAIARSQLRVAPRLDEDLGVGRYDYFSPYFNEDDVTFAFLSDDEGDEFGKAITVRRVADETPKIMRCTYWRPDRGISIRRNRSKVEIRDDASSSKIDIKELIRLHDSIDDFVENDVNIESGLADPITLFRAIDPKDEGNSRFFRSAFAQDVQSCRIISPIRALPERFYPFRRKFDHSGSHFAAMWLDTFDEEVDIFENIDGFGQEAHLFDSLSVARTTTDIPDPPLIVLVGKNGHKFTLDQVGIGVSQVAPILVDIAYAIEIDREFLLVQQPELHLHPKAQAAFGSFLLKAGNLGFRGVFETHSRFLIDRFRSDLRKLYKERKPDQESSRHSQAQLVFCTNSEKGNKAQTIPISYNGKFSGPVDDFLEFFVDEYIRTL